MTDDVPDLRALVRRYWGEILAAHDFAEVERLAHITFLFPSATRAAPS